MRFAGPLIAFRGASAEAPENTVSALTLGWNMGCDWAMVDARITRDGGVALMAEADLASTTTGQGTVEATDLAAIRTLALRGATTEAGFEPDHPAGLGDAIQFCEDWMLGLIVALAPRAGREAEDAALLLSALPREIPFRLILASRSAAVLAAFRAGRPVIERCWIGDTPPEDPAALQAELGLSALCLTSATAAEIAALGPLGLGILVGPVDSAKVARALLDQGAHGVLTPRPDLIEP